MTRRRSSRQKKSKRNALIGTGVALAAIVTISVLLGLDSNDAGKAKDHISKASNYLARDNSRAAVLELKSALQLDLENVEARLMLGRAYLDQGLGAAARKELEAARRLGSTDDGLAVDIARSMVAAGQFDEALKAVETEGQDTVRWKTVAGFALLRKQQLEPARSAFERALQLDESDTEARRGLAQAAFASGDTELAKNQLTQTLQRNDQEVQTWLLKGELELSLLDFSAAQASFEQVMTLSPDSSFGRVGLARALLAQNKADEASEHLRALERLKLNNPMVNYLRALEARQKNDIKTARDALREVLSVAPDHAPSQLLMGQILLLQRELDQAKEVLSRYVAQVPGNPSGRKLLAAVLLELDEPGAAIETLEPLERATPDDSQTLSLLGTAHLKLRNFDKGQMYMDRASKQAPEASAIRTQLAVTHLAKGDNESAATELQAVIDKDPQFERADFLLVLTHLRAGKLDAALNAAQALVNKHPDQAQSHNLLGAVLETRKEHDAARAAYRRSIELSPQARAGSLNIARMDLLAGNSEDAKRGFQAVLDANPGDATALLGLAKLASDAGDPGQSLELLERARANNPAAVRPRLVLANYYLRRGDADKALQVAEEAAAQASDSPVVQMILGRAQLAAKRTGAAIETFTALTKSFPDNPTAHLSLSIAQRASGRLNDARRSLQRTLQLQPEHHLARASLGALEVHAADFDAALAIADRLEKDIPDAIAANALRGDVHTARAEHSKAVDAYALAFKASASSNLLSKLIIAEQRAGRMEQARTRARAWLKDHPDDTRVRSLLAASSHESGNQDQAVADYERVLEKNPNNVLVLNNLAWLYDTRGDSRALNLAKRAYELLPDRAEIADTYGWLLVKSGKVEQGLGLLDKALKRAPKNGDIRYHHAAALHQAGESKRAIQLLDELISDSADFAERPAAEALLKELKSS